MLYIPFVACRCWLNDRSGIWLVKTRSLLIPRGCVLGKVLALDSLPSGSSAPSVTSPVVVEEMVK